VGHLKAMPKGLVLLLAATLTFGIASPAATRTASKPALKVIQRTPLKIRGIHFNLRERVRITAASNAKSAVRNVRTTARGRFTVDLGNWCDAVTVKAVGARGDRAKLVVPPPPPVEGSATRPCLGL
jgi:hypothetical protein